MNYLKAEINETDVRRLRLVPVVEPDAHPFVLTVHGEVGIFLRRADVAALLFAGQGERLAFYERAAAVSRIVAEAAAVEMMP